MPIYEKDMSFREMRHAERVFVCAVCKSRLIAAFDKASQGMILRCVKDISHECIASEGRNEENIMLKHIYRGGELPMESTALTKMDEKTMLERVNKAKWPKDLTPADKQIIVKVATEYGLDPLFGELMVYQGRPYVTIDARRRKAQETGLCDGISSRPATADERKARQVPEGDYLFYCEVWVKGASHPFIGWGHVRAKETKGSDFLPIVNDPMFMAEKRSEAQALRRAFHIPLPSAEEIIEGEFIDVTDEKPSPDKKKPSEQRKNGYDASVNRDHPTQAQINKLWTTANQVGWKASEVNNLVKYLFNVDSVKDLTVAQMSTVIKRVEAGEGLTAEEKASLEK